MEKRTVKKASSKQDAANNSKKRQVKKQLKIRSKGRLQRKLGDISSRAKWPYLSSLNLQVRMKVIVKESEKLAFVELFQILKV